MLQSLVSINIVPLCRVWLVLRFVNICMAVSKLSRYVTQLSLANLCEYITHRHRGTKQLLQHLVTP